MVETKLQPTTFSCGKPLTNLKNWQNVKQNDKDKDKHKDKDKDKDIGSD